jgi:DNA-binding response OmpR family regulator
MSDTVLLVEDEPALARGLVDNFRDAGYEVRLVRRGDAVDLSRLTPAVRPQP